MKEEISFGRWLYNRRRALDLTRQALANQAGCAEITLRRIENDTLKPSKELALILLEKLGIPKNDYPRWLEFARGLAGNPEQSEGSLSTKPATNLPSLLTSFIGREKEQADVISLITKHRIVTLLGMGGIGKTSLALQVGQKLLKDYPDGVWFIALDALTDLALVPQTVTAVFDLREMGNRSSTEMLVNKLRQQHVLLILDNCEHILAGCVQLSTVLLGNCPNLKILATSREMLNMAGEATYQIPSLPMPDPEERSLERLTENESVRLFAERASLALASFALTNENVRTVVDICRRVDGIPLAIELAAACVNFLQLTEILDQLRKSFALLSSDHHVTMSHHQTLEASLDWSWGLLNEAEQRIMRQLSVFAGGWTLEAAQAVCEGHALDLTNALVKKSLIKVEQRAGRATRYRFHELVRQYAFRKLLETGEEVVIRLRHLQYFLHLSERTEAALRGPEQTEWYGRIDEERDNLRVALEHAPKTDLEAGLYLAGRLLDHWYSFDVREGLNRTTKLLQSPGAQGFPHARAKAMLTQSNILWNMQQFETARSVAEECLAVFRAYGDRQSECDSLMTLARSLQFLEGMEPRTECHRQALVLARSIGDVWRQAQALSMLGWDQRDPQQGRAHWEEAITLFRQVGDWLSLVHTLGILGFTVLSSGDLESAEKLLDEAYELNLQINAQYKFEFILTGKSQLCLLRGEYKKARAFLQENCDMQKEVGNRMGYLWARARLARIAVREGSVAEAHQILVDVIQNFHVDQNKYGLAFALDMMASLCVVIHKPETAAKLIGWSDAIREEIGDPRPRLEQADLDRDIVKIKRKIGNAAWKEIYLAGRALTVEEAAALALREK
jgi:predicted ATPase/DNA-binding XRE family transcriptional regulator